MPHPRPRLRIGRLLALSASLALAGTLLASPAQAAPQAPLKHPAATVPDFGPNVTIFSPSTPLAEIQQTLDDLADAQRDAEMSTNRHAVYFLPGQYLNESAICALLGLRRTPVHQALDRLMLEGLVQIIPRKGVVVQSISLDQVLQIIDVRLVNEPFCVGLAAVDGLAPHVSLQSGRLPRACRRRGPR